MNTLDTINVTAIRPIDHGEAMRLQTIEYERAIRLLRTLEEGEWTTQTSCPAWDVRRMWLHVLGASEAGASIVENLQQMRAGRRHQREHGGPLEAGLSAVQVEARDTLTPDQLVDRLSTIVPKTIAGRRRTPRPFRALKMAVDGPVVEKWSLGYLIDRIYLRDLWMHRVDTVRATGRELELSADHDGRIIADIVAEWARRHGQPFELELAGPAGGHFTTQLDGGNGETVSLDAVEFCWILSGRGEATGLMSTIVPF